MQVADHIDHAGKRRQYGRKHQPARRLRDIAAAASPGRGELRLVRSWFLFDCHIHRMAERLLSG